MKSGFRIILSVGLMAGLGACDFQATDTAGQFVANVSGTYDQAAITPSDVCTENFDTLMTVTQTDESFIMLSENDGFQDLIGVFDEGEETSFTLTSGGTTCAGTFVDGLISAVCTVAVKVCTTDASTGELSCSDEEYSCQVTYQRR